MKSAILGSTGFVGGTLSRQFEFNDRFNSTNINLIDGRKYDLVVCAAAPGTKWQANMHPKDDWKSISNLMSHLSTIKVNKFILISTVDVYEKPFHVDENTNIDPKKSSPYGRHRFLMEQFVKQTFKDYLIVRLPGIFGTGIKKNIIYDFIHDHEVEKINPRSLFQFYNLENLWHDIEKALEAKITLLNIVTEPVEVSEIYESVFNKPLLNVVDSSPVFYDVRSIHATSWESKHYMMGKTQVLKEITEFVLSQRKI